MRYKQHKHSTRNKHRGEEAKVQSYCMLLAEKHFFFYKFCKFTEILFS